ncbi:hypothetical protein KC337_g4378 [Hortaea werneckii]|nr:hypothetical protein KC337_g4378 [Hortaea werneckii]
MRLRAAAVAAALLVARAKAQQVIQVSSAPYPRYSLTNSLPYNPAMNCRGEVPSTLPKDCSGPYSGTGYVGDFVDACGVDYAVHCGMHIDSDPFAVYEDVPELSKCMEACDKFPNCTSATHLGSRCLLDANASMKAVHGHPELAALIKGSFRGMRMQTAPPSMVREYRRQASRTSVNPAAATVPVCPNSNGQLYEDDYGALYIINYGAYNTGTIYTILWSRDSGCTTLRCCMDYCDGFQDCFGTALLLGTNNSTEPVDVELTNKYTDSYLYNRIICHGHANLVPHPNNHQRGDIDLDGDHNSKPAWDHRDFDAAGINQYGHIYSTCKHKYSHVYSACKYKHGNYDSANDAAARNYDPADYISVHISTVYCYVHREDNGHIYRTNYVYASGIHKYVDDYGKDDTNLDRADNCHIHREDNGHIHPTNHVHTPGVDKYIDDHGAYHPNIHASGVDEYINDHREDHCDTAGTTVTTTSILLSSYPLTQTETTSLLLTGTYISTYETTEVITSVQPTTIISTYPITYTSLQNITTTLSGPTLTETQRLTATNNVTATNTQTTTEQVPTYINRTTTLEASTITRTDTIFAPTETTTARDISTLSQPRETTTERETSVVYGTTTERDFKNQIIKLNFSNFHDIQRRFFFCGFYKHP